MDMYKYTHTYIYIYIYRCMWNIFIHICIRICLYVHKDIFMYVYCTHTMCVYMFSVHKRSTSSLIHWGFFTAFWFETALCRSCFQASAGSWLLPGCPESLRGWGSWGWLGVDIRHDNPWRHAACVGVRVCNVQAWFLALALAWEKNSKQDPAFCPAA